LRKELVLELRDEKEKLEKIIQRTKKELDAISLLLTPYNGMFEESEPLEPDIPREPQKNKKKVGREDAAREAIVDILLESRHGTLPGKRVQEELAKRGFVYQSLRSVRVFAREDDRIEVGVPKRGFWSLASSRSVR